MVTRVGSGGFLAPQFSNLPDGTDKLQNSLTFSLTQDVENLSYEDKRSLALTRTGRKLEIVYFIEDLVGKNEKISEETAVVLRAMKEELQGNPELASLVPLVEPLLDGQEILPELQFQGFEQCKKFARGLKQVEAELVYNNTSIAILTAVTWGHLSGLEFFLRGKDSRMRVGDQNLAVGNAAFDGHLYSLECLQPEHPEVTPEHRGQAVLVAAKNGRLDLVERFLTEDAPILPLYRFWAIDRAMQNKRLDIAHFLLKNHKHEVEAKLGTDATQTIEKYEKG